MTNGKMRGHEIDWRHYVTDRRSGLPSGYFDNGGPAFAWFHVLLGALIACGLLALAIFAACFQ